MKLYIDGIRKYAVFSGRAQRKAFWMFLLINTIIAFALGRIDVLCGLVTKDGINILQSIFNLVTMIPYIAVGVRRMHDTNHSGWWLLFPIVNFVFACTDGTKGDNRFGKDPKSGA